MILLLLLSCAVPDSSAPPKQADTGEVAPLTFSALNLNIFHGEDCPVDSERCRLPDRVELLLTWVAHQGCPDLVTLQEVSATAEPLIMGGLPEVCGDVYTEVFHPWNGTDDQLLLSRNPVADSAITLLYGLFRTVTWASVLTPGGPVEVFTTHFVSGADGSFGSGDDPCGEDCPKLCVDAGELTKRECQVVQTLDYVEQTRADGALALLLGDLNEAPDGPVMGRLFSAGWLDSYTLAGNAECAEDAPRGCTGRRSASLDSLESYDAGSGRVRVDYSLVSPGAGCDLTLDRATDDDGDGVGTDVFAADPDPFSEACGPSPDPICWISDHTGTALDLTCG